MNTPFELILKVAAGFAVGLCIGLERQWAHKEAGVRTFAIAALLGMIAWFVAPALAFVQFSMVLLAIILINIDSMRKERTPEITTSFALAATNFLGILVGMGNYFLAFACAIAITTLLSWKTELITFTSKLTVAEIRGALLLAFITAVVYPLLPDQTIDHWHIVNPRSVWFTVMLVSGLQFINYLLLRQLGSRGIRYSALLGGLVNSAATALLLGEEVKSDRKTELEAPGNMLLSDTAMILRNWALVFVFVLPHGIQPALATIIALVPMMLVATATASLALVFARKNNHYLSYQQPSNVPWKKAEERREQEPTDVSQQSLKTVQHVAAHTSSEEKQSQNAEQSSDELKTSGGARQPLDGIQKPFLRSPLSLRSVVSFGLLFLFLTVLSGLAKFIFGQFGFLAVIVVGALASAASSSVLVGQELARGTVSSSPAAIAMLLATITGLLENVAIFWGVTRKSNLSFRLFLFTLPIIATGVIAIFLGNVAGV
jgi:uncharacterized membrane protein (DUF4010 family)